MEMDEALTVKPEDTAYHASTDYWNCTETQLIRHFHLSILGGGCHWLEKKPQFRLLLLSFDQIFHCAVHGV